MHKKNHSSFRFLVTTHKQMYTKAIRSTLQSPIISKCSPWCNVNGKIKLSTGILEIVIIWLNI